MIFQRDLVSLRLLAIDIQKRLDIHIDEAIDLVHQVLDAGNGVVSFYTVGISLPELLSKAQVSELSLEFVNSRWWFIDEAKNEYGTGMLLDEAVFFLGYGEETGDKIFEGIQLLLSCKGSELPTSLPKETVFHNLPSKIAKQTSAPPGFEEESNTWDGFDEKAENYPMELDVALQAWTAVSKGPAVGRIRERLEKWVRTAYPKLPQAAVSRIVGVCNWSRSGGRPKLGE